jgi:GTPase SAR1 family protein
MRNVIIEGCDGAGKTTLINTLVQDYGFERHARASHSTTGPVASLRDWVDRDLDWMEEDDFDAPFIYDRHPLISEYIYAPIRWTNPGLADGFIDINWRTNSSQRLARLSILVICSPPYEEVERVLQRQGRDAHLPGVFENRFTIWTSYNTVMWPGTVIRYDRTRNTPKDLMKTLENL